MTNYGDFMENSEIMGVFSCVVCGKGNVKSMRKLLNVPQSTISSRLQFLRKIGIVKKNKWEYEPIWSKIMSEFYAAVKDKLSIDPYPDNKGEVENSKILRKLKLQEYFPTRLVRNIVENYCLLSFNTVDMERLSMAELVSNIVDQISIENDEHLIALDKGYGSRLHDLKALLKFNLTWGENFLHLVTSPNFNEMLGNGIKSSMDERLGKK